MEPINSEIIEKLIEAKMKPNLIMETDIGPKLKKALGLPLNTTWFELSYSAGEPLLMRVGYYPENIDQENAVEALDEYEIVRKPKPVTPSEDEIENETPIDQ